MSMTIFWDACHGLNTHAFTTPELAQEHCERMWGSELEWYETLGNEGEIIRFEAYVRDIDTFSVQRRIVGTSRDFVHESFYAAYRHIYQRKLEKQVHFTLDEMRVIVHLPTA